MENFPSNNVNGRRNTLTNEDTQNKKEANKKRNKQKKKTKIKGKPKKGENDPRKKWCRMWTHQKKCPR